MARDALVGGGLNVGIGALTGEEGHRFDNMGRNFASGALGGAAFRGGLNAAKWGGGKVFGMNAAGAPRYDQWNAAPFSKGTRGQWLGTAGVNMAAGMGAASLMPSFEGGQSNNQGYRSLGQQAYNQMQPQQNWYSPPR